jgi:hypothetical protein
VLGRNFGKSIGALLCIGRGADILKTVVDVLAFFVWSNQLSCCSNIFEPMAFMVHFTDVD